MHALKLVNVCRHFTQGSSTLRVFEDANMTVYPGEIVSLLGPSGAGKSSLLHIAGLLEAPTSGDVMIGDRACAQLDDEERTRIRREDLGFVYQFHYLLPEFTALENVALPQMIAGKTRAEANVEAARLLTTVGLEQRLDHRPARLSGGEQQRVAIVRALANKPRLLIADEPTGNLDPRTAERVFESLVATVRAEGLAALIATHNHQLADWTDRTFEMRDGRLVEGPARPSSRTASAPH